RTRIERYQTPSTEGSQRLEPRGCTEVALVGASFEDLGDLGDREPELVVSVEVVRSDANSGIRTEVADDLALAELLVHGLELRRADRDRANAARGVARAADLEAGLVTEIDQQLRLPDRVLADPFDADLLDQVVARSRCVERRHVRRAGQKTCRAVGVLELGLEAERPRMSLPADECRLEYVREIGTDEEPAVPRPAAEPLDAAADREVHVERRDVERNDAGRLIRVEHDVRADLGRPADDRLHGLDLTGLEQNVRDRHEQRALIDRV